MWYSPARKGPVPHGEKPRSTSPGQRERARRDRPRAGPVPDHQVVGLVVGRSRGVVMPPVPMDPKGRPLEKDVATHRALHDLPADRERHLLASLHNASSVRRIAALSASDREHEHRASSRLISSSRWTLLMSTKSRPRVNNITESYAGLWLFWVLPFRSRGSLAVF